MLDYAKIDRLADAYSKATDKASFLAAAWTDLTGTEGDALMQAIDTARLLEDFKQAPPINYGPAPDTTPRQRDWFYRD